MANDSSSRIELTERFLKKLDFGKQIIAIDPKTQEETTRTTPPEVRDWVVRDTKVQGLTVRVYPGKGASLATVSFSVQRKMSNRSDGQGGLKSGTVKIAMGRWPDMTLVEARQRTQVWIGMMVQGIHPSALKAADLRKQADADDAKKEVFGKVYNKYCGLKDDGTEIVESKVDGGDKDTAEANRNKERRKVIKWLTGSPLWKKPLHEVDFDVIELTLDPLFKSAEGREKKPAWGPKKAGLSTAWKCYRYTRAAYSQAVAMKGGEKFSRGTSPFALVRAAKRWPELGARQNLLETDENEGKAWLQALVGVRVDPRHHVRVFADFLICALVWGGRRRETQLLKWDHLDFNKLSGKFIGANTKSGHDHAFPLTPWVVEILEDRREQNKLWGRDGEWVFPSRHHGKSIADHRSLLKDLQDETGIWITAHDLRRTAANETAGLTQSDSLMVSLTLAHTGGRAAVSQNYLTSRVKLLRPLFEARERKLRTLAGLSTVESTKGPVDALIEFLQDAQKDPVAIEQLNKRAEAMMVMFVN